MQRSLPRKARLQSHCPPGAGRTGRRGPRKRGRCPISGPGCSNNRLQQPCFEASFFVDTIPPSSILSVGFPLANSSTPPSTTRKLPFSYPAGHFSSIGLHAAFGIYGRGFIIPVLKCPQDVSKACCLGSVLSMGWFAASPKPMGNAPDSHFAMLPAPFSPDPPGRPVPGKSLRFPLCTPYGLFFGGMIPPGFSLMFSGLHPFE
jgi:hypothetical protein